MTNVTRTKTPGLVDRWRSLSIQWKLLIAIIVPLIVVTIVLNIFLFGASPVQTLIDANTQANLTSEAHQIAARVDSQLDFALLILQGVAKSRQVVDYLDLQISGSFNSTSAARANLARLAESTMSSAELAFADLRIIDVNGDQLAVVSLRPSENGSVPVPRVSGSLESEANRTLFQQALTLTADTGYAMTSLRKEDTGNGQVDEGILEIAVPIYARGQLGGVVIGSFRIRELFSETIDVQEANPFLFRHTLMTANGQVLLTTVPQVEQSQPHILWWGNPELSPLPLTTAQLTEMLSNERILEANQTFYLAHDVVSSDTKLNNMDWQIVISKPVLDPIARDALQQRLALTLFSVFGVVLLGFLVVFVARQLTRPLVEMGQFAKEISEGNLHTQLPVDRGDEVGQVAGALNSMSSRVKALVSTLENDVNVRTRNLEIASEIARDAVQLQDINDLLQRTVDSIRDRFNFYHAQVFLVDAARENAVLITSTGEVGKLLLERKHKLAVGSDSIVGQVTAKGRTFITLDTERSEVPHRFNPLLPRTRSEMALPLRAGDAVVGALDIQSVEANAFDSEDVQIFQTLADQIASAIQNTRLFQETQDRLQQIDDLNRQLTARAWDEYVVTRNPQALAFDYDLLDVKTPTAEVETDKTPSTQLSTDIKVRGEVVGELKIQERGDAPLTPEDQLVIRAVAERVALAIENARLVERTQGALSEVERLYYATRSLSAANTPEEVYRILKDQISVNDFVDSVYFIAARPQPVPDAPNFETVYTWARSGQPSAGIFEQGKVFDSNVIPVLWRLTEAGLQRSTIVPDLDRDLVGYKALQHYHTATGVRSLLVAPLTTGARWFGLLLVHSKRPRVFTENFRKFLSAMTDQVATALENRFLFYSAEAERQTLEGVLNTLPTGVMVIDRQGHLMLTNDLARQLLGLDEVEPFERLHTATGVPYAEDDFPPNYALQTGEAVASEDMSVIDADGYHTDLIVNAVPVRDPSGNVISAVAVFQDVTELRELEAVLQESLRETTTLYEASRAIASENELAGVVDVLLTQTQGSISPRYMFAVFRNSQGDIDQLYRGELKGDDNEVMRLDPNKLPIPRWALKEEDQYIESEVKNNPELAASPEIKANEIKAFGVFPLLARSRTVGWLIIAFDTARELSPEERRFLNTIADQTAVAAESIRLGQETQQALAETTLLYEASFAINRADSIETAVEIMRDQVAYFKPTLLDIFLVNSTRDDYRIDWVVHIDANDPESNNEVNLDTPPTYDNLALIESDAYYIENVATVTMNRLTQLKAAPGWGKFSAQASIPLSVKGRITGRLLLSYDKPHTFSRLERQFLTALAAQAAVVIDNVTLVQQTQESLEETATLYQSSRQIADAPDMNAVLNAIIDHAAPPIVSRALIARLVGNSWDDPEATIYMTADWQPIEDPDNLIDLRYTPEEFPIWPLMAGEEMVWIEDIDTFVAMSEDTREFIRFLGAQSIIVLPLRAAGRSIGALMFLSGEHWPQSSREVRLYSSLADQAAITMQSRYLLEQTERRARQLAASAQVARAATSTLNLDDLFNETVTLIKDSFGYDHAQIFLVNEAGDDAILVASTGEAGRQLLAIKHHLPVGSQSIIGRVTSSGDPTIVLDTMDKKGVHRPNPYLPLTRSEMALPLIARNRIIGALDVQSNRPGTFTKEDINVLSQLADQVAVSIDNVRLFEISSRRADEMRFLFDATRAATSTMSEETSDALTRIARLVLSNLRANAAMIMLLSEDGTELDSYNEMAIDTHIKLQEKYDPTSSVFKLVIDSKQPAMINDVVQVSRQALPGLRETLPDVGSAVFVPLTANERVIGMIGVLKSDRYGFAEDSIRLLETLTSSLAAIIQNAQLLTTVQQTNVRLRELDKLKSQFLANMSHELRTPLNSIIGFSRVILKGIDGPLTEMQTQDLNTIHESGKHLLGLVNDILDQAKIEAGKMELQFGMFSIIELIKGVTSTAHGLIKEKPVRLRQEIDPTVNEVWGDEFRTRQVLLNLMSNAAKFTMQGSVTVSAFPIEQDGRQMVQISVTDTGIGIPPEKLDAVFEAFQQVENSTARQYEGTGLGLPIAKKLVELQQGKIWVNSEVNVGSTFSFTVPITAPEQDPETEEYEAAEAAADGTPMNGNGHGETAMDGQLATQVEEVMAQAEAPRPQKIILAIDDEVGMINLYRRYLLKAGYEIISARAEEAEELAIIYQPRMILLDVNMPNRSGWEVLRSLKDRDETYEIPVIICTVDDEREQAFRLGAADYLMKSIDEQSLLEAVHRVEATRDRRKVLIIDDQQESMRLLKDALAGDERFVIYTASNGADGLEMVNSQWPDLILLDLRMPEMDGLQVVEQLRAEEATAAIPVVIITADDPGEEDLAKLHGIAVYRKSAINPDELIAYLVSQLAW
jgi:PAS domain S-box-containing protein